MEVCALASGSSGNCFYVGNDKSGVLVDVGISAKKVIERLESIGVNSQKIKAIFITHEHIDHIRGVDVLARKLGVPIYATKATVHHGFLCSDKKLIQYIDKNKLVEIGGLKIEAFSKSHSAADPVSFSISDKKKVSVITDAGYACENIKNHIASSDAICIEANHDEKMLSQGPYPHFLKKWISGDQGHLSNRQAALCVLEHGSPKLKNIILSHLSETNNNPETARKTFQNIIKERQGFLPDIHVSVKEQPTGLFRV